LDLVEPGIFAQEVVLRVSEGLNGLYPPCAGLEHFLALPEVLYGAEGLTPNDILAIPQSADIITLARCKDTLTASRIKLQNPELLKEMSDTLVVSLTSLLCALPLSSLSTGEDVQACADGTLATPPFYIPVGEMLEHPGRAVEELILPFYADKVGAARLFVDLKAQLDRNLQAADQVVPSHHQGNAEEIVRLYLRGTPLAKLFEAHVAFDFPEAQRLEHSVIVAGSGHGKTQTLEALICQDLQRSEPPGMVVIDSKGDMIERLARLEVFNPDDGHLKDRLIVVDPRDSPNLNPFDIKLGKDDDEQAISRVIAGMSYFFKALLGSELSSTMRVALYPFLHLMVRIPGATMQTLIDAMADPSQYEKEIAKLPEAPRNYLQREYTRTRPETRNAIKDRLFDLRMLSPAFDKMFSAPRNRLDLGEALNDGKIVLVNLDRDFLEKEPSAILGKWFISQTHRAALRRSHTPPNRRRAAYLIVDEAGPYFDEQTEDVLRTMRSYRVGAVLAFQDFNQAPASLQSAIFSSTAIRLAGGQSVADAKTLADPLRTDPEFILSRRKRDYAFSEFACYVTRLTPKAISLSIPHGIVDRLPHMNEEQYRRLRVANRNRLTGGPALPAPPSEPPTVHNAPDIHEHPEHGDNDDLTRWR
jgi:hypothetical protein